MSISSKDPFQIKSMDSEYEEDTMQVGQCPLCNKTATIVLWDLSFGHKRLGRCLECFECDQCNKGVSYLGRLFVRSQSCEDFIQHKECWMSFYCKGHSHPPDSDVSEVVSGEEWDCCEEWKWGKNKGMIVLGFASG